MTPVVTAMPPAVRVASVVQRANVVRASVPERISGKMDRNTKVSVVTRVRKVPRTTSDEALAIVVVRVVTNRHVAISTSSASLPEVSGTGCAMELCSVKIHSTHREVRRLDRLLDAECVHVFIIAVAPAMRVAGVLQRACVMMAGGKEGTNNSTLWDTVLLAMRWVGEMEPAEAAANSLVVIRIMAMVHDWSQALILAGLVDVLRIHVSLHRHTVELHSLPLELHFHPVLWLGAHGIRITVVMPGPAVAATSVEQRAVAVRARVEVDSGHLVQVNTPRSIVVRVREMPTTALLVAVTIIVVSVVANGQEGLRTAGLKDIAGGHPTRHLGSVELDTLVHHVVPGARPLTTHRVAISVVVVPPAMRVTSVVQRACVVRACVPEDVPREMDGNTMMLGMVRIGEMPPATCHEAHAIKVVVVVADWDEFLPLFTVLLAGFSDVSGVHMTLHLGTEHIEDAIGEVRRRQRPRSTVGVHVGIPAPDCPPVAAACVLERASVVVAGIEEGPSNKVQWDAMASGMTMV